MDMRISNVYNAYNVQPSRGNHAARVETGRANDADSVSLSAQAGEFQLARKAVQGAPDIRESLVNRIQEMLDAGTYHVSSQDVAASILRR
jgi:flagellar biosynthesis anti-sigma factor FlgM